MTNHLIRCPCCDNKIIVNIENTGVISGVFFDGKEISEQDAFEKHAICLGVKGGEIIEK